MHYLSYMGLHKAFIGLDTNNKTNDIEPVYFQKGKKKGTHCCVPFNTKESKKT